MLYVVNYTMKNQFLEKKDFKILNVLKYINCMFKFSHTIINGNAKALNSLRGPVWHSCPPAWSSQFHMTDRTAVLAVPPDLPSAT